jgi:hypothetical protein
VVCVYDGASLSSYVDGALLGEMRATGALQPGTQPFTVARYCQVGPEWTFKGDVDFVRLYREPLEPWMVMRGPGDRAVPVELGWTSPEVTVGGRKAVWRQEPKLVEAQGRKAVDLDGGLVVALGETQLPGDSVTLETSFSLRSVDGMPVLINQGLWPNEGYMVQVIGKRLRFHIGGVGSLDCGPELVAGRWYDLKCTYDGATARAYLDGKQIGEQTWESPMVPSLRPLRIGHYEADQPDYVAHGLMGPTRILP